MKYVSKAILFTAVFSLLVSCKKEKDVFSNASLYGVIYNASGKELVGETIVLYGNYTSYGWGSSFDFTQVIDTTATDSKGRYKFNFEKPFALNSINVSGIKKGGIKEHLFVENVPKSLTNLNLTYKNKFKVKINLKGNLRKNDTLFIGGLHNINPVDLWRKDTLYFMTSDSVKYKVPVVFYTYNDIKSGFADYNAIWNRNAAWVVEFRWALNRIGVKYIWENPGEMDDNSNLLTFGKVKFSNSYWPVDQELTIKIN